MSKVEDKFAPDKIVYVEDLLAILDAKDPGFKAGSLDALLDQYAIQKTFVLNRQSAALILNAYAKEAAKPIPTRLVQISDEASLMQWVKEPVAAVLALGWLSPQAGAFNPANQITRGELAVIADRI